MMSATGLEVGAVIHGPSVKSKSIVEKSEGNLFGQINVTSKTTPDLKIKIKNVSSSSLNMLHSTLQMQKLRL